MKFQKTHVAALALAGALTVAAASPSFADNRWGYAAGGFAAGALIGAAAANANAGYYHGPEYRYRTRGYAYAPGYTAYGYAPGYSAPGYTAYGYAPGYSAYSSARGYSAYSYEPTYNPENPYDPDPRIGGSFKMNSSGGD